MSRLPNDQDMSTLLIQEDFRNIIYDFSFTPIFPNSTNN